MIIFQRKIENQIRERLFKERAILLFGPRQVGKTTLSKKILAEYGGRGEYFNCEFASVRQAFVPGKPELLRALVGEKDIVVFDEAQTVQDIGTVLKTFVDTYPRVQIIATGSSSFDLANKIQEPLTGRSFEFILLPLSAEEIRRSLPHVPDSVLSLGSYPAVVAEDEMKIKEDILRNLATNYLYKDIYMFESIRNPRIFEDLVCALALQVGSMVSLNELSQTVGVSRVTVAKYIRLLEQSYVIHVVRSFSRNPRNEIKKSFKVFFLDNGIRNAVIGNLSEAKEREDMGALWENFCVSERLKISAYGDKSPVWFWRNKQGEEIDIVEVCGGKIRAFECKWNSRAAVRVPPQFKKSYPDASYQVCTPESLGVGTRSIE